jgi:hypothetical protein
MANLLAHVSLIASATATPNPKWAAKACMVNSLTAHEYM